MLLWAGYLWGGCAMCAAGLGMWSCVGLASSMVGSSLPLQPVMVTQMIGMSTRTCLCVPDKTCAKR